MWHVTPNGRVDQGLSGIGKDIAFSLLSPFSDYENAVETVAYRYNWNNKGITKYLDYVPFVRWATVDTGDVDKVISCYINAAKSREIPEYVPSTVPGYPLGMDRVAACSGFDKEQCILILNELYYATLDGSIKSSEWLHPYTYAQHQADRESPGTFGQIGRTVEDVTSLLKWMLILGAIGVGGYYLWQLWPDSSDTKQLPNG